MLKFNQIFALSAVLAAATGTMDCHAAQAATVTTGAPLHFATLAITFVVLLGGMLSPLLGIALKWAPQGLVALVKHALGSIFSKVVWWILASAGAAVAGFYQLLELMGVPVS